MASLTNVISILTCIVRDVKNSKKMVIPLDCDEADLVHCLGRLNRHAFKQWHRTQLDWVYSAAAQNESLKRLCKAVASALQWALRKAELLLDHIRYQTFLSRFWSSRHLIVSALGDILRAFKAFRAVNEEPDLNACHIRTMVRRYLRETFDLMFLFGKFASLEHWYCLWEASLAASNFEDFRFDSDFEYAGLDRPQMENTNLSGVLEDPAQIPELCLPNFPTPPALVKNPGPYGARVYENPLSGLQIISEAQIDKSLKSHIYGHETSASCQLVDSSNLPSQLALDLSATIRSNIFPSPSTRSSLIPSPHVQRQQFETVDSVPEAPVSPRLQLLHCPSAAGAIIRECL